MIDVTNLADDRESCARFEELARQFARETGFLAPGKDMPLGLSDSDHDSRRRKAWDTWIAGRAR